MTGSKKSPWRPPSVDALSRTAEGIDLIAAFGRAATVECLRAAIDAARANQGESDQQLLGATALKLAARRARSIRPVINLTGSVLHTNLGRSPLAPSALVAMQAAGGFVNLEYDLEKGRRGQRDSHVERWLTRLTGAEAGIAVNNNAAAVIVVLNALARKREVIISRGELVEIGGAFRMPEVMARADVKLREVGATNRTHLADYADAITDQTAMILRVRPSNYAITGFTSSVPEAELAALAHEHGLIFYDELGSGALVDLSRWGLPYERTVEDALADGADIVSFSGDKLLGGPQAGLIVGKSAYVQKVAKNPLKRAIRLDKVTLAALEATLALYDDPDALPEHLPALAMLSRSAEDIEALASRVAPAVSAAAPGWSVEIRQCKSQIGSGALPVDMLESFAVVLSPQNDVKRGRGRKLDRLAAAFRSLPTPVIGRVFEDCFWLDCRCLFEEQAFLVQLSELKAP
jgi:L-seryl-tRNA(Ser) seleniumtransferase